MSRGRILYIEDNLENRTLVKRVLESEGYTVFVAENGLLGIGQGETLQPDLILMDINLPDIDGYECTARLRKFPKLNKTPIIALTANVMEGDRQKALDAGLDGYIPKPVDIDALPHQIDEHLRLGVVAQPVQRTPDVPVSAASAAAARADAPALKPPVQPAPESAPPVPATSNQQKATPTPSAPVPASVPSARPAGVIGAPPPPPSSAPPARAMPPGPPPPPPSAPPTMRPPAPPQSAAADSKSLSSQPPAKSDEQQATSDELKAASGQQAAVGDTPKAESGASKSETPQTKPDDAADNQAAASSTANKPSEAEKPSTE